MQSYLNKKKTPPPSSDLSILQRLLHRLRKILTRKALRIKAMGRTMFPNQIMRQLMAQRNPPIRHRINLPITGRLKVRKMQRVKVVEVEEERAVGVEGDAGAARVPVHVQVLQRHAEDGRELREQRRELVDAGPAARLQVLLLFGCHGL